MQLVKHAIIELIYGQIEIYDSQILKLSLIENFISERKLAFLYNVKEKLNVFTRISYRNLE